MKVGPFAFSPPPPMQTDDDSRLLADTVAELVREGADADLVRLLKDQRAEDLADFLEHAHGSLREAVFDALEPAQAGEVAALLDDTIREEILDDVPADELAEMVADLEPDEAVSILEDVDPEAADEVLRRLDPEDADELRELLGYDDESAGRAMAFGAPAVRETQTLGQGIDTLRAAADELDDVQTVFVVDGVGRLRGYLPLDVLLLRPPDTPIVEVVRRDLTFVYTSDDQETASQRAQDSHMLALPVIDARGVLRGQITHERLREIAEDEASEDMFRIVGLSEDESILSSFGFSLKKRLPWLLVNLGTAFFASWVISFFENTISALPVLAVLQSIVAGQGGNGGIQTITIMVRGLTLGDIDWRNSKRAFLKELSLGIANGACIGLLMGVLVWVWRGNFWLGLVIAAAMQLNLVAAALAGVAIPLMFRRFKRDPAQGSGVFVTMVTDVCGFFFFLGLATLLLSRLK